MSRRWQRELIQKRPIVAQLMMAAPGLLLLAGLRDHGAIGHYVRLGTAATLVLLIVAAIAAIVWANRWPESARERLAQFRRQKMAERPTPRTATRDPQGLGR